MDDQIKRMDINEFREKGYLQEVNRRFFHPLGLALEISVDENGDMELSGVQDYREDDEGMYFDIEDSDLERKIRFKNNQEFIDDEFVNRSKNRRESLGFDIEPIK